MSSESTVNIRHLQIKVQIIFFSHIFLAMFVAESRIKLERENKSERERMIKLRVFTLEPRKKEKCTKNKY